jgi:hypothetical protein
VEIGRRNRRFDLRFSVLVDTESPKIGWNGCILGKDDPEKRPANQELSAISLERETRASFALIGA